MQPPIQVQTTYHDLLQHHQAEPPRLYDGTIMRVEKSGHGYWVSRKRNGEKVTETAIGPDTPATQDIVTTAKQQAAAHQAWARICAADVQILRASGNIAPDMKTGSLLSAIARTGFFRAGGVLGGTQAFRHYPLMLGVRAPSISFAQTGDVDLLASRPVQLSGPGPGLASRIQEIGIRMEAVFGLDADQPPKWRVDGELDLEFLSPVARGGQPSHLHPGIGERVQALRYLEYSIQEPEPAIALYRSGVALSVPAPGRYALHKLIVAQLRNGVFREKRSKDLAQAEWLVSVLCETRRFDLWQAWDNLIRRGRKWKALAMASVEERPVIAGHLADLEEEFGPAG